MRNLFLNEWLKIRYCKQLWFLSAAILVFVALMAFAPGNHYPMAYSGCTASFAYLSEAGCIVLMLQSCVFAFLFTNELAQGTMQNALRCGISRGRYFAVKFLCCLGAGLLIYLLSLIEYLCIRTLLCGFWPKEGPRYPYPDYISMLFAYYFGSCILICTLMSALMLSAVCVRKPAAAYLAGVVICVADLQLDMSLPRWNGIYAAIFDFEDMAMEGNMLTQPAAALFAQSIATGAFFLALAYLIFRKKDIH